MNWTLDDWKNIAWSDESRFQLLRADGRIQVWRRPLEAVDLSYQKGAVEACGGSIIEWAVFTWHGLGPVVKLKQSLTGNYYVELLGDHLQTFMDFMYPDNEGIFQDDNTPYHWAKIICNLFKEHSGQFQQMIWPPRSSGMNSIEHGIRASNLGT
ncbi:hypothetical protein AVEN_194631-1 [Araneus ventricosus]|uniref:Tc1-like transposase DDE domain-containing protein n=1 Tax=Araneus ventricosus TaxID=182803 RepID=A0A4Y2A6L5_ARAVE|nr:hypothetical protein AVEN_194631-1 [Araneus ventricosus]